MSEGARQLAPTNWGGYSNTQKAVFLNTYAALLQANLGDKLSGLAVSQIQNDRVIFSGGDSLWAYISDPTNNAGFITDPLQGSLRFDRPLASLEITNKGNGVLDVDIDYANPYSTQLGASGLFLHAVEVIENLYNGQTTNPFIVYNLLSLFQGSEGTLPEYECDRKEE